MFCDALQFFGDWRFEVYQDGKTAKDELPLVGADLILLDVGLPNLDGVSLYKILRGHSKTKNTPIIVITGSHDWELHRKGLRTGLLLRKPFNVQELLFMISALLDPPSSESLEGRWHADEGRDAGGGADRSMGGPRK